MREQLAEVDRNSFSLIIGLIGVLLVAVSLVYLLIPAYKDYRELSTSYDVLNAAMSDGEQLEDKLNTIANSIEKNQIALNGDASSLPFKQFESHVIGQLQSLAWQNHLVLAGVRPGQGERVDQFQEVTFEVTLYGEYFDIYRMLSSFNTKLGFVVIKKLSVNPAGLNQKEKKDHLNVQMTVASYRNSV